MMKKHAQLILTVLALCGAEAAPVVSARAEESPQGGMAGMDMSNMPGMDMSNMGDMNMAGMDMSHGMMAGTLGPYSMMRDASGTSWQPDSAPMAAIHGTLGSWMTMIHGDAFLVYDHQGGRRGDNKTFSESMLMGMAQRGLDTGILTLQGMVSFDPLMGKSGYPLLLQTGETADGVHPLIDRQHPYDFLMELSGTYSAPLGDGSAFVYAGYPGEPALGPATFMHRLSGMENPEAPITHHWLEIGRAHV